MAVFNATTVELGSCDRDLLPAYLLKSWIIISLFIED